MKKEKRTKVVHVRFTEKEYETLTKKFERTTSNQLSHYIRSVLLQRPVVVKYRNESLDAFMEELINIKQELNAMGNNFNQAVKKLHVLKQIPEFREWIAKNEVMYDKLLQETSSVEKRIAQISDKWLQE